MDERKLWWSDQHNKTFFLFFRRVAHILLEVFACIYLHFSAVCVGVSDCITVEEVDLLEQQIHIFEKKLTK